MKQSSEQLRGCAPIKDKWNQPGNVWACRLPARHQSPLLNWFLHKALSPGNVLTHVNEDHWCKWPRPLCGTVGLTLESDDVQTAGMWLDCLLECVYYVDYQSRGWQTTVFSLLWQLKRSCWEKFRMEPRMLNVVSFTAADCWESAEVCLLLHPEHVSGSSDWHGSTHLIVSSPLRLFN